MTPWRELPDPDLVGVWWRVAHGRLQWRTCAVGWSTHGLVRAADRTPERIAVWTDLALNPVDP